MQIVSYQVDLRSKNTPKVIVHAVTDDGEPLPQVVALDDDARCICDMANGVATGCVDFAALEAFVAKRLEENANPTTLADLVARAEKARETLAAADLELEAKRALVAAEEDKLAAMAAPTP